jgi:TPR repeat protein
VPVDYTPLIHLNVLIGVIFAVIFTRKRIAKVWIGLLGVAWWLLPVIPVYVVGYRLEVRAVAGDPAAQFEYARWLENHVDTLHNRTLLWLADYDFRQSVPWLEAAAKNGHAEALYALGVRHKYAECLPPGTEPLDGETLVKKSIERGYRPNTPERQYYWLRFRKR